MSDKIDKLYDLIENMYVDLSQKIDSTKAELNQKIDSTKAELNQKIDSTKAELNQNILLIEQNHGEKLDALLDGYKQLSESQKEIKADIEEIKTKLENQEVEIKVIKGGKSKRIPK
ncbi:MAG: hypothetical protein ACOYIF_05005 [Acetivibrionales bacterium]|jgi:tetrahydromethanopterin S-methyltransferase subunit G